MDLNILRKISASNTLNLCLNTNLHARLWAIAPAKPPQTNLAESFKTSPPVRSSTLLLSQYVYVYSFIYLNWWGKVHKSTEANVSCNNIWDPQSNKMTTQHKGSCQWPWAWNHDRGLYYHLPELYKYKNLIVNSIVKQLIIFYLSIYIFTSLNMVTAVWMIPEYLCSPVTWKASLARIVSSG